MSKIIYLLVFSLLLALISAAAYAQYETPWDTSQPNWNIHAGGAWLFGDTLDDAEVIVGLGYEWLIDYETGRDWLGISVDYIPVSSGTGTETLVPILVYLKGMGILGDNRVWGAFGIGTSWVEDDIPGMRLTDGFNFAWSIQAGVDLSPSIFAQVRYIAGDDPGDDGFITTELGFRF